MITMAVWCIGAYLTVLYLLTRWDGTEDEPAYCVASSLFWPLFWSSVAGLRLWFAWRDRSYWRGK